MSDSATITVTDSYGASLAYKAPVNLLDLEVSTLTSQDMTRGLAFGIVAKGLKLYAHGELDLGYGAKATIVGQL